MNLDDLAPAPWVAWRREQRAGADWPTHGGLASASGPVKAMVRIDRDTALDADFAEFAALARNAFDGDPEALAWWEANRKRRAEHEAEAK